MLQAVRDRPLSGAASDQIWTDSHFQWLYYFPENKEADKAVDNAMLLPCRSEQATPSYKASMICKLIMMDVTHARTHQHPAYSQVMRTIGRQVSMSHATYGEQRCNICLNYRLTGLWMFSECNASHSPHAAAESASNCAVLRFIRHECNTVRTALKSRLAQICKLSNTRLAESQKQWWKN